MIEIAQRISDNFDDDCHQWVEFTENGPDEDLKIYKAGYLAALPRWIPVVEAKNGKSYFLDGYYAETFQYYSAYNKFAGGDIDIDFGDVSLILDVDTLPQPPEVD